ncbi:hypothetical protein FRB99_001322 [Tulasnella sp. 403]|nr:hypothetical protein FRB99_001322 [Tulasnella sp. 403]
MSNNTMEAIIAKYGLKTKKEDVSLPPKLSTAQDVCAHQDQDHSSQTVRPIPIFVQLLFSITHEGLIKVTGPSAHSPSTVSVVIDQYMESLQDLINPPILAHDNPWQIHPFLQRSRWASWLQGLEPQDIKNLQSLLNPQEGLVILCHEFLVQMEPWITSSEMYITWTHLAAKLDTQTNKLFKPIQCKTPTSSTIITPLNLSSCHILLIKPLQEVLMEFQNPPKYITVAHQLGQLKEVCIVTIMQPLGLGDIRSYLLTAFIILTNTQVDMCIGLPNTITLYLAMQGIMHLASSFTTNISHLLHFLWGKDSDQSFLFNGYCIWIQDMVKMVQDAVAKYQNLMKQLYQMLHLPTTLTINLNSMCDSLDDQQVNYFFGSDSQNLSIQAI